MAFVHFFIETFRAYLDMDTIDPVALEDALVHDTHPNEAPAVLMDVLLGLAGAFGYIKMAVTKESVFRCLYRIVNNNLDGSPNPIPRTCREGMQDYDRFYALDAQKRVKVLDTVCHALLQDNEAIRTHVELACAVPASKRSKIQGVGRCLDPVGVDRAGSLIWHVGTWPRVYSESTSKKWTVICSDFDELIAYLETLTDRHAGEKALLTYFTTRVVDPWREHEEKMARKANKLRRQEELARQYAVPETRKRGRVDYAIAESEGEFSGPEYVFETPDSNDEEEEETDDDDDDDKEDADTEKQNLEGEDGNSPTLNEKESVSSDVENASDQLQVATSAPPRKLTRNSSNALNDDDAPQFI